ncbi:UNVERIFIED_CONTAM: hypothetical protein Sradi_2688600 [Sesamum radiatum]|uniref:CCHC-type domain-containing protein n=1 Tax=Sesamum radiatum TaxID=300843 RepID=A0AAW2S8S3_SESRA
MIAISIEEEHRNQTNKMPVEHQPRANLIVGKQRVNKINSNSKAINKSKTTKNKKPKANKPCWNCGQVGHWAKLCPNKKAKTGQAVVNMVVGGSSGASTSGATEGYVSVQPELLTIYEPCDWLIDTGANVHVCADKSLYVSYQAITGKTVSMGNSSTAEVLGIGSVDLKFPSGRILSLKRVHHVPTVRRNIISGSSPSKTQYEYSFRIVERNTSSVSLDDSLASTSIPEHVEKMTNVGVNPNSASLTHEESDIPRRSKRARVVKDFGSDFVTYNIEDDPVTFKDAMASLEAKQWKEAVKSEMDSIVSNGTWVYNLSIHQMDVKTAFLYGELEDEIYMDQPKGFVAYAISQSHYVEKILEKFGYQNSRIAKTPYDSSVALFKNESGVSVAQLRVLRYLKGTVSLAIHYGRFPTVLEGYSDASWIAKNSGSNGCSGYVFTLGGGAVSWKSAKQTLITRSTFEAELCALDTIGTEAEWLFGLFIATSHCKSASSTYCCTL